MQDQENKGIPGGNNPENCLKESENNSGQPATNQQVESVMTREATIKASVQSDSASESMTSSGDTLTMPKIDSPVITDHTKFMEDLANNAVHFDKATPDNRISLDKSSAGELDSDDIRFENTAAPKLILAMEEDEIAQYINCCNRQIQRWRIHLQHAHVGKARISIDADGNLIKNIDRTKKVKASIVKAKAKAVRTFDDAVTNMAALLGMSNDEARALLDSQKGSK